MALPLLFKSRGWVAGTEGWVYEIRCVTHAGRIIARSRAHLGYDDADDIRFYLDESALAEIERAALEVCKNLVPRIEVVRVEVLLENATPAGWQVWVLGEDLPRSAHTSREEAERAARGVWEQVRPR